MQGHGRKKELYILVPLTTMVFFFLSKEPHISIALGPANCVAGPAKTMAEQNLQVSEVCCLWSPRSGRLFCLQLHCCAERRLLPVFSPTQVTVVLMILKNILLFPLSCPLPSHHCFSNISGMSGTQTMPSRNYRHWLASGIPL